MPQTTGAENACDAEIFLDNAAGALQDISGSSNSLGITQNNMLGEFNTFGSRWRAMQECGKAIDLTLNAVYTLIQNEAVEILIAWFYAQPSGRRTVEFNMPNNNVGSDHYEGEFRLESLDWTMDPSDPSATIVTAELKSDLTQTHTTTAT